MQLTTTVTLLLNSADRALTSEAGHATVGCTVSPGNHPSAMAAGTQWHRDGTRVKGASQRGAFVNACHMSSHTSVIGHEPPTPILLHKQGTHLLAVKEHVNYCKC
jgi:hypothetical protein